MKTIIRQEENKDFKAISNVIKSAFEQAEYSNKEEHNLIERLRKSKAYIKELSLVAEVNKEIVGHIMFSKAKIGKNTVLALAPVSVLPKVQRCNIGSELIKEGHRIAKKMKYAASIVLGDPAYYSRFGYEEAEPFGILPPFNIPSKFFMIYKLQDEKADLKGSMIYADEFEINQHTL